MEKVFGLGQERSFTKALEQVMIRSHLNDWSTQQRRCRATSLRENWAVFYQNALTLA
jgi:hypothetical protein